MSEHRKLNPCPFCKSEEVNSTTAPEQDEHGLFYWICPECICVGPVGETLDDATLKWNKALNER